MQQELEDTYPQLRINLIGVNELGHDYANGAVSEGRDLPWLQDVDENSNGKSDVWYDLWDITYRDVMILNGDNVQVDSYNLTTYDLDVPANYAELREKLIDAAMDNQLPWQNPNDQLDVDANGVVIPLDVLLIINELNTVGNHILPPPEGATVPSPYFDCNGDNIVSPNDALYVVNYLNGLPASADAEGESIDLAIAASHIDVVQVVSEAPTDAVYLGRFGMSVGVQPLGRRGPAAVGTPTTGSGISDRSTPLPSHGETPVANRLDEVDLLFAAAEEDVFDFDPFSSEELFFLRQGFRS